MDFGQSKPSLINPKLVEKLIKKNNKKFNYLGWIDKNVRDYILIGLFIIIVAYFLYRRYYYVQLEEEEQEEQVVVTDSYNKNLPYYEPPQPQENYQREQYHDRVARQQHNELVEQKRVQFKVNHPTDISEPQPININPIEAFQPENLTPQTRHPYDFSLKATSFTNMNPVLVGNNFAPV